MVTKQGADDAMEARKAFEAVHEDIEHAAFESKASSALVERVYTCGLIAFESFHLWYFITSFLNM